jgi:hypothetical protein
MKWLLFCSIVFCKFYFSAQTHNFDEDSIQFYFMEYLDEYRNELYPGIPKLLISPASSNACRHHNEFLRDVQEKNGTIYLTHDEFYSKDGRKYKGTDTIIDYYMERVNYYNTDNDFGPVCEVIALFVLCLEDTNGVTNFITPYMTNKKLGWKMLEIFKGSEKHNKIISGYKYNMVAVDVSILNGFIFCTMVTGQKFEHVDGKIITTKNSDIYKND